MFERAREKAAGEAKRDRADCCIELAICHAQLDDIPLALKPATAATEEDKTFGRAWLRRGVAHGHLGQMRELGLEEFMGVRRQAMALGDQGDHAGALALHQHTPESNKRNRSIDLTNISSFFGRLNDFPHALKAATAATEEHKTYWRGWLNRSSARHELAQWAEAVISYEEALAMGLSAEQDADGRQNLQFAKDKLAAQQAKEAADAAAAQAAAEQAEQARLAAAKGERRLQLLRMAATREGDSAFGDIAESSSPPPLDCSLSCRSRRIGTSCCRPCRCSCSARGCGTRPPASGCTGWATAGRAGWTA